MRDITPLRQIIPRPSDSSVGLIALMVVGTFMIFGPLWEDEEKPKRGKRRTISKDLRAEVWKLHIGISKAEGPCYACGRTIHITEFDVGHNIAKSKGGTDNVKNLRPICRQCNRGMATMSIETYKKKLKGPATRKKKTGGTTARKKQQPSKPRTSPRRRTRPRADQEEIDPFGFDSFFRW